MKFDTPSNTAAMLREQEKIAKLLDFEHQFAGPIKAEILAGAYIIGTVNYLTKRYGSRRAYEAIQQIADRIPEFKE